MFALASLSGSGPRVFFASAPYTSASCRAFSTAPDSRSSPKARRTSASALRRFRMSRSRSSTSIALPSFSAWIVGVSLLADLPLREGGADVSGDLDDVVVELPANPERFDEKEIARHERVLQSELLVRREASPAHLAAVVDVVVDERGGMDELEGCGAVDGLANLLAAEGLECEERHHRPDPLAPGLDHVPRDVVEQWFFGDDAFPDAGLDHREFFSHAKVERTHEPGRPIASYRLALYNHFRGTKPTHARERSADGVRRERIVPGTSGAAADFAQGLGDRGFRDMPVPRHASDRRRDGLEERMDHIVAVPDPIGHHDDGHHDRHERVDERLVLDVRAGEVYRLRRQVRDAPQVGIVVFDREVRVVI